MKPFISVIVPAYNAEKTIEKTIGDVLGQTYDHYELILVDDGSTDRTPEICDRFASEHPNVSVIHQENRGLSGARNRGTASARGAYVSYVDSDDRIEKDYLEVLVEALNTTGAQIACGRIERIREKDTPEKTTEKGKKTEFQLLDRRQAAGEMLTKRKLKIGAGCRLVPREWMTEAPFLEGKYYEDLSNSYKIILRAESIAVADKILYHYVMRSGSITGRKQTTIGQCLDYYEAIHLCADGVRNVFPEMGNDIAVLMARDYMSLYLHLGRCEEKNSDTERIEKEIISWMKGNWSKAAMNKKAPINVRLRTMLFRLSPGLYEKMYYAGIGLKGKKLG